jgi:hypothetical protein
MTEQTSDSGFRLGRRAPDAGDRAARARVEAWTRTRFELNEDETVLVAEMSCGLPGCPPVETLVAFWSDATERRQFKVFKPVADVDEGDLPPRWMKDAILARDGEGADCC